MNVWHDDITVHEAPSSLTPEILVGLFRYLEGAVAPDDPQWSRREVAGVPLLMQMVSPHYDYAPPEKPATKVDDANEAIRRMARKMRLNSDYGSMFSKGSRTFARGVEIVADDDSWLVAFNMVPLDSISDMYPHVIGSLPGSLSDKTPPPKFWDGDDWVRVNYVEVRGDHDKFIHEMTKIVLFESQWLPLPPDEASQFPPIQFLQGSNHGYGASAKTMQAIGRSLRYPSSQIITMFNTEKSVDQKMLLKIIKNRNT